RVGCPPQHDPAGAHGVARPPSPPTSWARSPGSNDDFLTGAKATAGAGQHASNPFLQETPDPVSKVTWDNYVTMSKSDMVALGLNTYIAQEDLATVVKVTVGDKQIELPAFMHPGQKPGTIGIALGYGRGSKGEKIGQAAYQTG
ncbi:MAG: hypothetical protein QMC37_10585, partial [Flavobacteriales bacterium]